MSPTYQLVLSVCASVAFSVLWSDLQLGHVIFHLQTEKGSALHEAALFGKTDVVQILLAAGEDIFSKMFQFYNLDGNGVAFLCNFPASET